MKKQIAVCPECSTKLRIDFKNNGRNDAMCPKCNSSLWVTVEDNKIISVEKRKTQKLDDSNEMNSIGQLSIVRFGGLLGHIGTKKYDLHLGSNTIGRKDSTLSSNIEVEGDTTMSRRSVSIEVTKNPKGNYLFKMNVLRAANPVLHNNQQLVEGEGVYLNYGDSIRLGKTTFVFDKK